MFVKETAVNRQALKLWILAGSVALLSACAVEPGSEKWCEQKEAQPKSEWSLSDASTYAQNCLLDGTAIGSKSWCESLSDKPKGEWTVDEAADYAKHCVI